MKILRREFLQMTGIALPTVLRTAHAQAWPSKAMRVIISGGAGSAADVIPRIIFESMSAQLGQPIIVENRPAAGGTLGINAVVRAEPDGYNLLASSSAFTVLPWVYPKIPYDPVRDISAIIPLGTLPTVLVTSPAKGFKTIVEFVASARAKPGSFNYTSTGTGNATHLNAARFCASAGIAAVHIPVKSGPEALTEVISGRAEFYFCPIVPPSHLSATVRGHAADVDAIMQEIRPTCPRAGHPCLSPRQAAVSIVTSGPEPRQLVLRQAAPNRQCGAGAQLLRKRDGASASV